MKNILFRVDAGKEIGLGHYKRCLAISNQLNGTAKSLFLTKTEEIINLNKESQTIKIKTDYDIKQQITLTENIIKKFNVDVVLCDINNKMSSDQPGDYTYYLDKISKMNILLVSFEDFKIYDVSSDIIIIPYIGANKIPINKRKNTTYLLGPKYFIIRDEFMMYRKKNPCNEVRNILIGMGGSDSNNLTKIIIQSILGILQNIHLNIIKGPLNKFNYDYIKRMLNKSKISFEIHESPEDISRLMGISDLGIISSGLTQYEASVIGLPTIVISLNDYHKQVVDEYAKMDSIISFGILNSSKTEILEKTISNLINDQYLRKRMSINGKNILDGKGIERLISNIKNKLESR